MLILTLLIERYSQLKLLGRRGYLSKGTAAMIVAASAAIMANNSFTGLYLITRHAVDRDKPGI